MQRSSSSFSSLPLRQACRPRATAPGSIVGWGYNPDGRASPPAGNDYVAIAAGLGQSLAVKSDGSISSWGRNLGAAPAGNDYVAVAAGGDHNLALKSDGTVVGWGANGSGQITAPAGAHTAIAAGYYHSVALRSDGAIAAWGDNTYGQASAPAGTDYVAVAAGHFHSVALRSNGSIAAWGRNDQGQATPPGGTFVAIAAGAAHGLGLRSDAGISAWGSNSLGQASPPAGNDYVGIASGNYHGLALKTNGSLAGWGWNNFGEASPPAGNNYLAIAAGDRYSLALRDVTAPTDPTLSSSSHTTSAYSNDPTVDVTWSGASDPGSGVDGFSYLWNTSASTLPDTVKDAEESATGTTSPSLANGTSHYFHLRTRDNAGNWTSTVHLGPFWIDTAAPTDPTLSSSSHSTSVYSNDPTVEITWSGASDSGSGVDGFSYLWDTSASTLPDTVKDAEESATGTTSSSLTDGTSHYVHLRTRDNAGNWTSTVHLGPFWIESVVPGDPTSVSSTTHATATWSTDRTIDVAWSGASDDPSGVDGFSYQWDTSASTLPDTVKDAEETATGTTSPSLADGTSHYFHLRTRDNAGNWTSTVHLGPFWIDDTNPSDPSVSSASHTTSTTSNDPTIDVTWSGASDATSGVDGFSYLWDTSASTVPDTTKDAEESAVGTTSPTLADGSSHYFHLRTRDNAGNWTSTVHLGPFWIDTSGPKQTSCKTHLIEHPADPNGTYVIDADGGGALAPVEVYCEMVIDGGGWTFGVKNWFQAGVHGSAGAVGSVSDALTRKGNPYKLSDAVLRALIGPGENFDVMADQNGYNSAYSTGNYERVILRNYTGFWQFDAPVAASTTTTTMQSYRTSDGALAWTGELSCGAGGAGINCTTVVSNNPQGGAGCGINMGSATNSAWHFFYMGESNSDTYLYICNGAQHSSSHDMNHRWWFRERDSTPPADPVVISTSHTTSTWSSDQTVDLTWSGAADGETGVDGFSYLWDTSASTLPDTTKDAEESATGTTSPTLADGNSHYFHLRTRDNAGNWTSTVHLGPFWIDATIPSNPSSLSSTSHTISVSSNDRTIDVVWSGGSDATSGVDGFSYLWNTSASTTPDTAKDAEQSATGTTSPPRADGTNHYFHLRTRDNAGNWSAAAHLGPFWIDGIFPAPPEITSPLDGAFIASGLVSVVGTTEADAAVTVKEGVAILATPTADANGDWDADIAFSDGVHTVKASVVDTASNPSEDSAPVTFTVDTVTPVDPSVVASSHATGVWSNDPTIDVGFSGATDATAGVDGFSYLWDTSPSTLPDTTKDAEETAPGTTSPTLADGSSHYFHLRTRDNAGNWTSTVHTGPFWIDATLPSDPTSISSTSHTASTWSQDRTVDVAWSGASDAGSGVDGFSYLWDTSASTVPDTTKDAEETATGATSPALADGNAHYFHLRTRDNAGNWTSTAHLGPYWIDDTNPTGAKITSSAFSKTYQTSTSFPVSWTAFDATSGIVSYTPRYRVAAWNGSFGSYIAYGGANGSTFKGSTGRTYCFDVRATDNAGNSMRSPVRCTAIPLDDRSLSAPSSWTRLAGSIYYLGTTTRSTTPGAKLVRTGVKARKIALLVTRCPTCGTVDVFLGSTRLRRISLYSSTTLRKTFLSVASFSSTKTGTVTVKVVSSGKPVSVDGLGVSRV